KDPGPDGTYLTADDTPFIPIARSSNYTYKLSYQASAKHRFIYFGSEEPADDTDYQSTRFTPHEASKYSKTWTRHNKGEWQAVFSDRLMANMIVADTGYHIAYRPHEELPVTPCQYYVDTGVYLGNGCIGFVTTS